jgi:hypothetical protein
MPNNNYINLEAYLDLKHSLIEEADDDEEEDFFVRN